MIKNRKSMLEARIARLEKMLKNEGKHGSMSNLRRLITEATGCKVLVLFTVNEPRVKSVKIFVYCGSDKFEYEINWMPVTGYVVYGDFLNERISCDTEEEAAEVIIDSVNQA